MGKLALAFGLVGDYLVNVFCKGRELPGDVDHFRSDTPHGLYLFATVSAAVSTKSSP